VGNDQGRSPLLEVKGKQEREDELQQLLETRAGRLQIWALFSQYCRRTDGRMPPSGPALIGAILAHEFPHG
jgi:hypothetical protein